VTWLERNDLKGLVKVKKSPDWAKLKKDVEIAGDKVVSTYTGEIVDGVKVVPQEPEFKVEV